MPYNDRGGQRTISGHRFSPSTTLVPGIRLGSSGLAASAFTLWTTSPADISVLKALLSPPTRHFHSWLGLFLTQGHLPDKESMVGRLTLPVRSISRANIGTGSLGCSVLKPQLCARGCRGRKGRRPGHLSPRCKRMTQGRTT